MDTFGEFQKEKSAYIFSNEPLVYLSNEYLCLFQKSIEDLRKFVDAEAIMVNAAQQVAYHQFSSYFKSHSKLSIHERKKLVEDYFCSCGFGKLSLKALHAKGGYVETRHNVFAQTWLDKYGERPADQSGVSYFALGMFCGITEAIFGIKHGSFSGRQSLCIAKGDDHCRFEIFRGKMKTLKGSPGLGGVQEVNLTPGDTGSVDFDQIADFWLQNFFKSNDENGVIEAFGQTISLHYANYFCLVALNVLIDIEKKVGRKGVSLARVKMIDASNFGTLKLVHGLLQSDQWKSNIASMIKHKDETVYAVLASLMSFGWGYWKAQSLSEAGETTFEINGGFESNAFEKLIGKVKEPICYFAYGCGLGLMNSVYNTDLNGGASIDDNSIESICKGDNKFLIKAAKTRASGNGADVITVGR